MRRKNRSVEIFSLSAIDMFASALGAFVILTAILMPYYPNMKDGGAALARMTQTIETSKREAAAARARADALRAEIAARKAAVEKADEEAARKAALSARIGAAKSHNSALEKQIAELRKALDALKKEIKKKKKKATPTGATDFSILGITTKAKSIVLVVDLSGSMNSQGRGRILVDALLEILEPFHKGIKFAIVGYQGAGVSRVWPPRGMAWADPGSKASAQRFIVGLGGAFNGGTPTKVALLHALNVYRPDALILVSDGRPTGGNTPQQIVESITRINRGRVEINTVAIGNYLEHSDFLMFLNNLAKRNGGSFVGMLR